MLTHVSHTLIFRRWWGAAMSCGNSRLSFILLFARLFLLVLALFQFVEPGDQLVLVVISIDQPDNLGALAKHVVDSTLTTFAPTRLVEQLADAGRARCPPGSLHAESAGSPRRRSKVVSDTLYSLAAPRAVTPRLWTARAAASGVPSASARENARRRSCCATSRCARATTFFTVARVAYGTCVGTFVKAAHAAWTGVREEECPTDSVTRKSGSPSHEERRRARFTTRERIRVSMVEMKHPNDTDHC